MMEWGQKYYFDLVGYNTSVKKYVDLGHSLAGKFLFKSNSLDRKVESVQEQKFWIVFGFHTQVY